MYFEKYFTKESSFLKWSYNPIKYATEMVKDEVTTEASIKPTLSNDFYMVLGNKIDENAWVVRTYIKPFISFIWIGVILIALGGFVSLLSFNKYKTFKA